MKIIEPKFVLANIDDISSLKDELQLRFFELIRTLSIISQEIPKIDSLMAMTFDSTISEGNYERIVEDIGNKYNFVADQCIFAVRKISSILRDPAIKIH